MNKHLALVPTNGKFYNVLIADDNMLIRDLLTIHLIKNNYQVFTADNGLEALQIIEKEQIDIVLLDLMMPKLDGIGTLKEIRKNFSSLDLPVLIITAMDDSSSVVKVLELGANDYVTKPLDIPVVLARLQTQLSLRETKQELEEKNRILEKIATLDELTGIPNRRYFNQYFMREWERASRSQIPISIIFCDIDFFKTYNDFYGHPQGDVCIKKIAQILQKTVRRTLDIVSRYGGEEFVIVLPDTDEDGAFVFAERTRMNVEEMRLPHANREHLDHVTISLGVATMIPSRDNSPSELINLADQRLYRAKDCGRNCTRIADVSK